VLTGSDFVGSRESREGPGGFRAQDPSTGEVLEPAFAEATPAEVDAAARVAQAAFEAYAALPPMRRAAFLRAIAEQLVGLGDALLEKAGSETALPRPRLEGEPARTAMAHAGIKDAYEAELRTAAAIPGVAVAARSSGHGPNAVTEAPPALLIADAASFVAHDRHGRLTREAL
jgi:2,5-dioxopentanoate dehydrogenase